MAAISKATASLLQTLTDLGESRGQLQRVRRQGGPVEARRIRHHQTAPLLQGMQFNVASGVAPPLQATGNGGHPQSQTGNQGVEQAAFAYPGWAAQHGDPTAARILSQTGAQCSDSLPAERGHRQRVVPPWAKALDPSRQLLRLQPIRLAQDQLQGHTGRLGSDQKTS